MVDLALKNQLSVCLCPQRREIWTGERSSEDGYMKLGISQYQNVDKIVCLSTKVGWLSLSLSVWALLALIEPSWWADGR